MSDSTPSAGSAGLPYQHTDPARLYAAAGFQLDVFRKLTATFMQIAPPMLTHLEAATRVHDCRRCMSEAHALRGTVGLVGATRLVALLQQIESDCRRSAALPDATSLAALRAEFAAVLREVETAHETFSGDDHVRPG